MSTVVETVVRASWPVDDNEREQHIQELFSFVYPGTNESPLSNPMIVMEILGMINDVQVGWFATQAFLHSISSNTDLYWKQHSYQAARNRLEREIFIYRAETVGITGVGTCKFCGSKELNFAIKQLRSADEPATVFIRCSACHKTERIG